MSTISTLEAETTTLYPNVGEHVPSDADVMSLKKEYFRAQQILSLWLTNWMKQWTKKWFWWLWVLNMYFTEFTVETLHEDL